MNMRMEMERLRMERERHDAEMERLRMGREQRNNDEQSGGQGSTGDTREFLVKVYVDYVTDEARPLSSRCLSLNGVMDPEYRREVLSTMSPGQAEKLVRDCEDLKANEEKLSTPEMVEYFVKAADQGDVYAQYNLGILYYEGKGLPQDFVLSHVWSNLAASRFPASEVEGRRRAIHNRDLVASKMTPDQIAEAQRMAREWKPTVK